MNTFLSENQHELISFPFARERLQSETSRIDPDLDIIVKPSDGKILGVVPRSQYIMPHIAAVQKVEDALRGAGIEPEVSSFNLLRNGARMFVHYRVPSHNFDVKGDHEEVGTDILFPEIILKNGYDGDTVFGLEWGLYRLVCSNGARALVFGERATRKILMGDTDVDVIVTQVKDFLDKVLLDLWARVQEMITNVAPTIGRDTREWIKPQLSGKLLEIFDKELEEREALMNEWVAFNLVTNLISHHVQSYNRRRALELATARHFKFEGFAKR